MKKLICTILSVAIAFSLCACGGTAGGKIELTVDQSAVYLTTGETAILPKASAKRSDGTDVSDKVTVRVKDGDTVVLEGAGNAENAFSSAKPGKFVAEYSAADGGEVSDVLTVNILVTGEEKIEYTRSAPVITVEKSNVNVYEDGTISTRAAIGYDETQKDISASVAVTVTNYAGEEVFSGAGNTENLLGELPVGTYEVRYTLRNDAGLDAEPAKYILTVVANVNTIPELFAPKKNYSVRAGETHVIPAATANDYEDGALEVRYAVTDAANAVVKSGTANAPAAYVFAAPGEYKVTYECEDEAGVKVDSEYFVTVTAVTNDGIAVDGVANEKEYLDIDKYVLGIAGNTTYRFIVTDEGLYIAAEVTDHNLIVSNLTNKDSKLNNSDGVDFVFDPKDTDAGWLNVTDDTAAAFRMRVGVDGTVAYYKPLRYNGGDSESDQWTLMSDADIPQGFLSAVTVDGTIATKGQKDTTTEDNGYIVEVYFPWTMLGYTARPDRDANYGKNYIRCGFGQRDVKHTTLYNNYSPNCSDPASRNNVCFNGMNVTARPKAASEGLHLALYSKFYVAGETLGVNPYSTGNDEVTLDGCMSEPFWNDAIDIPCPVTGQGAKVTTRLKTTDAGIYMGVFVADGDVTANRAAAAVNNYGISGNDMIDVRIITGDEMKLSALVPFAQKTFTDGKVLLFDPAGSAICGMLQQMGVNRPILQVPFGYGIYVDGTCAYSSDNEGWLSDNRFVADTDNRDADGGWGVEVFLPWETVGLEAPSESNPVVEFMAISAVYDRNFENVKNASWTYSYRSATSISKSDPTNPSTYFPVKVVYDGGNA